MHANRLRKAMANYGSRAATDSEYCRQSNKLPRMGALSLRVRDNELKLLTGPSGTIRFVAVGIPGRAEMDRAG